MGGMNWKEKMVDDPSQAGRTERDLIVALAPAIGPQRASDVKVFSRYNLSLDSFEMVVRYGGKFYQFGPGEAVEVGEKYLDRICAMVIQILGSNPC